MKGVYLNDPHCKHFDQFSIRHPQILDIDPVERTICGFLLVPTYVSTMAHTTNTDDHSLNGAAQFAPFAEGKRS
jgi:hypothetical protein